MARKPKQRAEDASDDRIRRRRGARELETMIEAAFSTRETAGPPLATSAPSSPPDRRTILVDGFNVLHAVLLSKEREAAWWRRSVREDLLRRVAAWRQPEDELWVAFDGAQPAWSCWAEPVVKIESHKGLPFDLSADSSANGSSDLTLHPPPDPASETKGTANTARRPTLHSVYVESADDWIVRRARRAARPEQLVVVSADRQVTGRARSAGCEIWSPWTFMSRCPRDPAESTLHATAATHATDATEEHERDEKHGRE